MLLEFTGFRLRVPVHVSRTPGARAALVVLLFAWIGAEERYLAKYDELWDAVGARVGRDVVVVRVVAPIWLSFDASLRDVNLTAYSQLLDEVRELLEGEKRRAKEDTAADSWLRDTLTSSPVLLNFFSNGGAYAYEALTQHLPSHCGWLRRVIGTVFDSW
jgi:hypothetical protein